MDLTFSLMTTIEVLGFLQGVILGTVLLIANFDRSKSKLLLAIFILTYALGLFPGIVTELGFMTSYFDGAFEIVNMSWLFFPLFYGYVQNVSILSEKIEWWPLRLGIGLMLLEMISFFVLKDYSYQLTAYILNLIFYVIFDLIIAFKIIWFVRRHVKELKNQYSSIENRELLWARNFALIGIGYTFVASLVTIFFTEDIFYFTLSVINILLLYWVSLRGIFQQKVIPVIAEKALKKNLSTESRNEKEIGSSTTILESEMNSVISGAKNYLIQTEVYTKPDLTIRDVSTALDIHSRHLSSCINQCLKINFNAFINNFRIEKAKAMLKEKKFSHLSVEGIGLEVGFKSRSTFYAAFKRETGTTPSEYRRKNSN